ncbi:hypothetical protein EZS27_033741, partial [termite gut metagenome]
FGIKFKFSTHNPKAGLFLIVIIIIVHHPIDIKFIGKHAK